MTISSSTGLGRATGIGASSVSMRKAALPENCGSRGVGLGALGLVRGRGVLVRVLLGTAGKAEPVNLADDRVARHPAQFRGDLARAEAVGPQFLEHLDTLVSPTHGISCSSPLERRNPGPGWNPFPTANP